MTKSCMAIILSRKSKPYILKIDETNTQFHLTFKVFLPFTIFTIQQKSAKKCKQRELSLKSFFKDIVKGYEQSFLNVHSWNISYLPNRIGLVIWRCLSRSEISHIFEKSLCQTRNGFGVRTPVSRNLILSGRISGLWGSLVENCLWKLIFFIKFSKVGNESEDRG